MAHGIGSDLEISSLLEVSVLRSACPLCEGPDDGKMVNCDNCNQWFHFECVGVNESESERDWSCVQCNAQVPTGPSTSDSIQELRKQIELLERKLAVTQVKENQKVRFDVDSRPIRSMFGAKSTGAIPKANSTAIGTIISGGASKVSFENDDELEDELRLLDEKHALEKRQLQERYAVLQRRRSSTGMNQAETPPAELSSSNSMFCNELSRSQLAARQAVSRDLPVFYGHPEEWPLFHASFESSTRMCGYSDEENLLRLQRSLKGKALDAVRSRLLHPSNLPGIMSTLKTLFGRPEVIVHSLVTRIREMPSPKAEKLNTLIDFGIAVQNVCATIKACGLDEYLCNIALLQELVERLPPTIKLNWALYIQTLPRVTLSTFGDWLEKLVEAACVVTIAPIETSSSKKNRKQDDYINVHSEETVPSKSSRARTVSKRCVICEGTCSSSEACETFRGMSISSRWSTLREKKLCKKCLNKHFGACNVRSSCGKNGCTFMHHPMLHDDARYKATDSCKQSSSQSCNAHSDSAGKVLFRYIPVTLHGKNVTVKTHAFLDDGSSATFMEQSLLKELKLEGTPNPLCLNWTGGQQREEQESVRLQLEISGGLGNHCQKYVLPKVHTVRTLALPSQSVAMPELSSRYQYLQGLPICSYDSVSPRLLIGIDNCHVGHALKSKEGTANEPVATKTRLGWLVYGPCSVSVESPGRKFSACHSFHICTCSGDRDADLNTALKEYFSIDSLGIQRPAKPLLSKDDERATQLLLSRTHLIGNRYATGLLWRSDGIHLPDSRAMAEKRLVCLERRLSHDQLLTKTLQEKIVEYEQKGYIRKLSPQEVAVKHPRKWYLPIFPVVNPNKPGKVRIVWDAAAKVGGISLNSALLTGPDQLASLPSVLYRFREYRFAIAADIREMFHQVQINKDDQQSQRFLWRDGDTRRSPDVYVMKVMTFGATCSPSCAQFVKNTNAARFQQQFPQAVTCIQEDHYVDDLLTSVEDEQEAVQLAKNVQFIHAQGGFELHNWLSNSKKLRDCVRSASSIEKDLNLSSEMATEKVLGMWWSISSDTFTFKLSPKHDRALLSGQRIPTKRELLKTLMRIYDPLGLIAGFLMFLKILLQEVWRAGTGWDADIPPGLTDKWMEWLRILPQAENIQIPRCYRQATTTAADNGIQLHTFVDAGRSGFVAMAYLRFEQAGKIECSLVGAKARVAPLKYMSVPRLELQAAVIGTRLAASIVAAHRLKIVQRYFWTDSRDVICWLKSDHRRYSTFVAHRVGEILEASELAEWKWISTRLNPADEGTKWQKIADLSPTSRWFSGPAFLRKPKEHWPVDSDSIETTTEEIRSTVLHHSVYVPVLRFDRFSKWKRLLRATAYALRYLSFLRRKTHAPLNATPLTKEELEQAEWCVYRQVQQEAFPEEYRLLDNLQSADMKSNRTTVQKTSKLYKLNPYVDSNGILRMQSRIRLCQFVDDCAKYPILLPKQHYLTDLVIADYHCHYKHINHETVINQIRLKFHIPQLRTAYKRVRHSCQVCKIQRAEPHPPMMADLPVARMAAFTRPFSYTGVDYFGPMPVIVGRRTEKRWGVLMTCLTVRAIHIEIAYTLSTDSCILALRNFVARRGAPIEIFSDRGTNFVGANRVLRKELEKVDQHKIMEYFVEPNTKWTYNPPAAPHFGGSWERLVQSVKKVLNQVKPKRIPTDELLRTMMSEVEMIVNSRPLTHIPLDVDSLSPLTPNHILLGSSNGSKPPIAFNDSPVCLKNSWKASHSYADEFWNRFVIEYLPTLTRRSKWFQRKQPIEVGDVALNVDKSLPRNCWPKGRVVEVVRSKDQQVRRATLQTAQGRMERPAVNIAILDVGSKSSKSGEGHNLLGGNVTLSVTEPPSASSLGTINSA